MFFQFVYQILISFFGIHRRINLEVGCLKSIINFGIRKERKLEKKLILQEQKYQF